MSLAEFLHENETALLGQWTELVLSGYPPEARRFLEVKDQFANPLGYNLTQGLRMVYRSLRGEEEDASPFLEQMMKIMALQDEPPSRALGFIFALKGLVEEKAADLDRTEVADWSAGVDAMALAAFDFYAASRERLFKARLRELESGNHMLTRHGCPSAMLDANDGISRRIG